MVVARRRDFQDFPTLQETICGCSTRVYIAGTRNLGTAMRGNERGERSPASGYINSHRTQWELRCDDMRPARCCSATGARRSCGAAACVQQLSRSHGEAAGACRPLQPQSAESAKQVQPYYRRVRGRGSWVASQSLGSPPVSGTAVSSGSAVKRDSWIAVLGPVATSAIVVLVVGMPRRG